MVWVVHLFSLLYLLSFPFSASIRRRRTQCSPVFNGGGRWLVKKFQVTFPFSRKLKRNKDLSFLKKKNSFDT
ncbi:hypothetical protein ES288_A05G264100v1 [Gossypium darwinii]|uniref:Secreted protein n=1 Tax=Gossypium darwinii TaxID=34276 RepID=A0A5D2GK45_GOSDA|nr:hypothetical protein ES288_A05G264100v1 [Gossypium darwinii]